MELQLELKHYKAVEAERSKWEAQETWWRKEIYSLRSRAELHKVSHQKPNITPLYPDHTLIGQSNSQSAAKVLGLPGQGNPRTTEKEVGFYPAWLLPLGILPSNQSTALVIAPVTLPVLIMLFLVTTAQRSLLYLVTCGTKNSVQL